MMLRDQPKKLRSFFRDRSRFSLLDCCVDMLELVIGSLNYLQIVGGP